jgi:hypothetical protein
MGFLFTLGGYLGIAVLALTFGLYFLVQLICGSYYKTQNLKKRYTAQWALVTGASSGRQVGSLSAARRAVHVGSWP